MLDIEDPQSHKVIPGSWRNEETLCDLPTLSGNTSLKEAKVQRNYLRDYYNSDVGRVPWQDNMI
jgi:hypothetical protein